MLFAPRVSKLVVWGNSKETNGCFTSDSLLVASAGFNQQSWVQCKDTTADLNPVTGVHWDARQWVTWAPHYAPVQILTQVPFLHSFIFHIPWKLELEVLRPVKGSVLKVEICRVFKPSEFWERLRWTSRPGNSELSPSIHIDCTLAWAWR